MKPHHLIRSDSQTETATGELRELLTHRHHLAAWLHAEQMRLDNAASDELRRVLTAQIDWLIERIDCAKADLVHAIQGPIRNGASSARCRKVG